MRSTFHHLFYFVFATGLVSAQNIVPTTSSSSFPACAVSCAVLKQAESLCFPPNVAANTQLSYENCFCQSSILALIYSTPDAVCAAECNTVETDREQLRAWYLGFCQQVGQNIDPLVAPTSATPSSTVVVTITSTSTSGTTDATITGSGSGTSAAPASNKSWIGSHWKWILMVAVLFFGFIGIAVFAVWLKRRHRRKVEERRAAASGFPTPTEKRRDGARSATPDLWGPHQHMAATKGWEYHTDPSESTASGGLSSSQKRELRGSKKEPRSRGPAEMSEINGRPVFSRRRSTKGKNSDRAETAELDGSSSSAHVSRSRSRRKRDKDKENKHDRDVEQGLRGINDKGKNKELDTT